MQLFFRSRGRTRQDGWSSPSGGGSMSRLRVTSTLALKSKLRAMSVLRLHLCYPRTGRSDVMGDVAFIVQVPAPTSAMRGRSQPVAATLYLKEKRWSVTMDQGFRRGLRRADVFCSNFGADRWGGDRRYRPACHGLCWPLIRPEFETEPVGRLIRSIRGRAHYLRGNGSLRI
jgi:hypothetical protein